MKNLLKRMPKKVFGVVAVLAIAAGITSSALAGFGPNRETRDYSNNQGGFDHVTFNSFTNVPNGIGDERDFFRGHQVGTAGTWSDPVNGVTQTAEVEMHILVHNNANPALNESGEGVAKNVNVRAVLPAGAKQSQQATAYISSSNAQPQQIFDTVDMTGAENGFFEVEYIPGSAKVYNHETKQTTVISDSLVTTGVNLGDQKGCVEFIREVTFRVKVKMPRYQTQKTARRTGEGSDKWREVVNANIGDKVDWRIWFKNSGQTQLNSVKIVDDLPPYVKVVPGSVKLYNGNYPNGYTYPASAVQKDGKQINVDIGAYLPGGDAYVIFTTEIENAPAISCGIQQLANVAYATPQGYKHINDSARVTILNDKPCEGPTFVCESLSVEKLGDRKVRATVKAPVSGNAKVKTVTFNYGDGSAAKVTDKLVDEYEYKTDGSFKITATVTFTVDGTDKVVTSENCTAMVSFGKDVPKELPKTGASLLGLVTATTVAGGFAHNFVARRRNG